MDVNTAIIAGLFALLGAILGGVLNLSVERKKNEGDLILEAVKTGDTSTAARNLLFFSDAGLIHLSEAQIHALKDGSGSSVLPVLPPSGALEKFTPVASTALTPELNALYTTTLGSFQGYLRRCGFKVQGGEIKFKVVEGDSIKVDGQLFFSLYDPETNMMQVASKYAIDTDLILHEYMRHVLSPQGLLEHDPSEDTKWWAYYAVESGLAVYYPCSFNDRPRFGSSADYATNLENASTSKESPRDPASANSEGNTVWAGAFWELRHLLGEAHADRLVTSSWISWHPLDSDRDLRASFVKRLIEVNQAGNGGHDTEIQAIFKHRGLSGSN